MHVTVEHRRADIAALCRRLGVRRLSLFGSATGECFNEATSDLDFVVEFNNGPGFDYFDAYFSLKEGLEALFDRPVDLVTQSSIKNPYFAACLAETQEFVYAA